MSAFGKIDDGKAAVTQTGSAGTHPHPVIIGPAMTQTLDRAREVARETVNVTVV